VDLSLQGKVALVAASSSGIGKAIAMGLALEGVHVSIFSRNLAAVEQAASEISAVSQGKVLYRSCDLGKVEQLEETVRFTEDALGPIEILVNNQGGPAPGGFDEITEAEIRTALKVNLESVLLLSRLCLPAMKHRGWGRILNILSFTAREPAPGMFLSNMLRPAVAGFAKTLAYEVARFGITVNSLLPGSVLTKRSASLLEAKARRLGQDIKKVEADTLAAVPIGRFAGPDEIAALAVFLCSPKAAYITGACLPIDGGLTRGLF